MSFNQSSPTYAICKGSLLTRHQYDRNGQCIFEFWVKHEGQIFQLIVSDERPVCFITATQLAQLRQCDLTKLLSLECKPVALKTFDDEPGVALYVNSLNEFYLLRQLAKQHDIELLEGDIRPVDRYLMERFVTLGMTFSGRQVYANPQYCRFEQVKIKASEEAHPHLNALSVDIECDEHGYLYSIGCHQLGENEFQCVLFNIEGVSGKTSDELPYVEWLNGERALLQRFNQIVAQQDPDCLIGWNFVGFDINMLDKAAERNQIRLKLGRDGSPLYFSARQNAEDSRIPAKAYAAGRVMLDGIEVMKNATYQFTSFGLDNVASELLGERKLIQNQHGFDKLAEIKRQYKEEPVALARYNLQDCVLVSKIFAQENLLEFLLTRTELTGLELEKLGGSVAAFTNLYLPKMHRLGWIAPNLVKQEDYLHSPGGFVMESKPGMFDDVLVFDFKSLYPSIIRTFNVDPISLQEGLRAEPLTTIEGFRGGRFSRNPSILSTMVTELWLARDKAKKDKNAVWSNAIKIIMNSFYGVLGSAGCRFYDTRLASSITMRGHWILEQSRIWFEQKGLVVIYGDTDSIFISTSGTAYTPDGAKKLETELNAWWTNKLADEFSVKSHLEIEFETHFSPFFMPTIRGMEKGSKKRYAGLKQQQGEPLLVFKGMESVRSDWTDLAKQFQTELFKLVFNKQPVTEYLQSVISGLFAGEFDELLIYRKKIRQHLNEYVKTTPPQIKAAKLANNLYRQVVYRRGSVIPYVMTINGPRESSSNSLKIDYQHYLDKQLFPIAESILENISPQDISLFNKQMTLNW